MNVERSAIQAQPSHDKTRRQSWFLRSLRLALVVAGTCAQTAFAQSAPGGVSTGLSAWHEAGTGFVGNTSWACKAPASCNYSGASALTLRFDPIGSTTGAVSLVAGAVNFNPAIEYTGRAYMGSVMTLSRDGVTPRDQGSAFAAGFASDQLLTLSRSGPGVDNCDPDRCDVGTRTAATNFGQDNSYGGALYSLVSTDGPNANVYGLWSTSSTTSTNTLHSNTRNGATSRGSGQAKQDYSDYQLRLGSFPGYTYSQANNALSARKWLMEGMYYTRKVSDPEAVQISSYLAIKYGVTLDADATRRNASNFDYRNSSNGIVWNGNAASYSPYHTNVIGIGRDAALDQRISASVNGGNGASSSSLDILTLAHGALSSPGAFVYTLQTNVSGQAGTGTAAPLATGQYLMTGHDGAVVTAVAAVTVAGSTDVWPDGAWQRLSRRWRAQNTGGVGVVSVRFDLPALGVTALGGDLSKVALLIDDDGNYGNGGTRVVTAGRAVSGNQISFNVTLANAEVFTLAFAAQPRLQLYKQTVGGVGGPFQFTLSNTTQASGTATTTSTSNPVQVDGDTSTVGIQSYLISSPGNQTVITESAPANGYALTAISCSNAANGAPSFNPTYDIANRRVIIPNSSVNANANINCTFTNTLQPTLTVRKVVTNDNGGAATVSAFGINTNAGTLTFGAATGAAPSLTYTSNILVVNPGTYTLAEADIGNYTEGSWSCSGNATPMGGTAYNAGSVTVAVGEAVTCSITNNDSNVADLAVLKTSNPSSVVEVGSNITYTLRVSNNGPATVTGAVVTDSVVSGLSCPAATPVTCSSTTVGACPAGSPTVGTLTGTGITMGALAVGQFADLQFSCAVQ